MQSLPVDTFCHPHINSRGPIQLSFLNHYHYAFVLREFIAKQHTLPLFAYMQPDMCQPIQQYVEYVNDLCLSSNTTRQPSRRVGAYVTLASLFETEVAALHQLITLQPKQRTVVMPQVNQSLATTKRQRYQQILYSFKAPYTPSVSEPVQVFKVFCMQQMVTRIIQDVAPSLRSGSLPRVTFRSAEHIEQAWQQLQDHSSQMIEHLYLLFGVNSQPDTSYWYANYQRSKAFDNPMHIIEQSRALRLWAG